MIHRKSYVEDNFYIQNDYYPKDSDRGKFLLTIRRWGPGLMMRPVDDSIDESALDIAQKFRKFGFGNSIFKVKAWPPVRRKKDNFFTIPI